mmetsp:Transcript_61842/g.114800  ORF Transcript_61842/g.114800 Transcript_61842/m.114800 type:complete len:90 (-) Transcript_61842:39-308(-)
MDMTHVAPAQGVAASSYKAAEKPLNFCGCDPSLTRTAKTCSMVHGTLTFVGADWPRTFISGALSGRSLVRFLRWQNHRLMVQGGLAHLA